MGLDITAYSSIKFLHPQCEEAEGYDDHFMLYSVGYTEQGDGLKEGCYSCDGGTFEFRAGSYSGYNRWREILSMYILGVMPEVIWKSPNKWEGKPFVELINMSDCEGFIGTKTSQKLAKDFQEHFEIFCKKVNNSSPNELDKDWCIQKYKDWTRAFITASNGGAVKFH